MKDIDWADQYLSYYSIMRKTVKWLNVSAKLYTLQDIFVYKTLNIKKIKYKNVPHDVTRYHISEVQYSTKSSSDDF
jgi:hypothetical protein